ncbi:MAG: GspH/FimT family pseudopilin [Luteibacter sp.]
MPRPPAHHGFTWLELLVALTIAGLLAAIALPALGTAIARHRLDAAARALVQALDGARMAAVGRPDGTVACPSHNGKRCTGGGDWSVGWIVRDGGTGDVLAADEALDTSISAMSLGQRREIAFSPPGGRTLPPTNQALALCVRGKPATAMRLVIAKSGHVHAEPAATEVARACAAHRSMKR